MFEQDAWGRNRLHWAALSDDLTEVKFLLNRGLSMDVQDNDGMTAFRLAIQANNLEVVKCFMQCGAKVTKIHIREAENRNYREMSLFLQNTLLGQSVATVKPQPHKVLQGVFSEEQLFRFQSVTKNGFK